MQLHASAILIAFLTNYSIAAFQDSSVSFANPLPDASDKIEVVYEAAGSMCYNEGRAAECMPPFTNVAEGTLVQATSTCGEKNSKTERFCTHRMDAFGKKNTHCEPCNAVEKFHPKHLTDRHQVNNESVWVSGPIGPGEIVNLTLSLGKTFEVHYISLRPYGRLPDAITLYKSSDFGKTWQAWQHFSTDCYRAFRLPTSNERNAQISAANIHEVLCVALKESSMLQDPATSSASNVIAFSTVIGRSSSHTWSPALVEWMTMTDLRVSLRRFANSADSAQHDMSGLLLASNLLSPTYVFRVGDTDRLKHPSNTVRMTKHHIQADAVSTQEDVHYAFSDLAVGGRCKCNGHANRCVRDRIFRPGTKLQAGMEEWGPLRCECQHNTAGTDCEQCAPGYMDRPWARATTELANECKRCDCNLHSNSCSFSEQVYLMSQKSSGGVCQECQHNTVGRKCHYCASGFYRDWTKPISHDQVCVECHCHSIGSIANQPCDRKTGQCPCKPGVVGQTCDRCQEGYKQTNLSDQPCVRATEHFAHRIRNVPPTVPRAKRVNHERNPEPASQCAPCKPHKKRVRFKNFCRREAVFLGTVMSHKMEKDKYRYEVSIQETWRVLGVAGRLLPKKASANLPPFPIWVEGHLVRLPNGKRVRCYCPEMKFGETYLFLTDSFQIPHGNRMELMLNSNSYVLPWRETWRRRLNKFVRRAARGRCSKSQMNRPHTENEQNDATRYRQVQHRAPYYMPNYQTNTKWASYHRWNKMGYNSPHPGSSVQNDYTANGPSMFQKNTGHSGNRPKPSLYSYQYHPYN